MISRAQIQTALHMVFPPRCLGCGGPVENDFRLCGACWRETPFIAGAVCDACALPLPGDPANDTRNDAIFCDRCLADHPPWRQGRAALIYQDAARQMVLRLKHGDRHDIARPAARWMVAAAAPLIGPNTILAPIPLHWSRFLKRKYNQSALLAEAMAQQLSVPHVPDLLLRTRATPSLDGLDRTERTAALEGAIVVNPKHHDKLMQASVLIVDDVLTSGATFSTASLACKSAQVDQVNVIALARVAMLA